MAAISVRRLDDGVVQRFRRRARANDRSLEAEIRHALVQVVRAGSSAEIRRQFLADVKELQERYPAGPDEPAEVLVRRDRDHGHREL